MSVRDCLPYDVYYRAVERAGRTAWNEVNERLQQVQEALKGRVGDLTYVAVAVMQKRLHRGRPEQFVNAESNPELMAAFISWASITKTVAAGAEISLFDLLLWKSNPQTRHDTAGILARLAVCTFFTRMHLADDALQLAQADLKPSRQRQLPAPHFALKGGRRLAEAIFHRYWDGGVLCQQQDCKPETQRELDEQGAFAMLDSIFTQCTGTSDDGKALALFPLHVAAYVNIGFRRWASELEFEQLYGRRTESAAEFAKRLADFCETFIVSTLVKALNQVGQRLDVEHRRTSVSAEAHRVQNKEEYYKQERETAKIFFSHRLAVLLTRDTNGETVIGLAIKSGNASLAGRFLSLASEESFVPEKSAKSFVAQLFSNRRTDELARASELSSILLHRDREGPRYMGAEQHPIRLYELITTLNDEDMLGIFEHHALRDAAFIRPAENFVTTAAFYRMACIVVFFFVLQVGLPQTVNFVSRSYFPDWPQVPFFWPLILLLFSIGSLCLVYDDAKYSARSSTAHRSAPLYSPNPLVADTQSRVSLWHIWITITSITLIISTLFYWYGLIVEDIDIYTFGMNGIALGHLLGIFIFVWVYLDLTCIVAIYRPRSRGLFSSSYKSATYLVARRDIDRLEDRDKHMTILNKKLQKLNSLKDSSTDALIMNDYLSVGKSTTGATSGNADSVLVEDEDQITAKSLFELDDRVKSPTTGGETGALSSIFGFITRVVLFVPLRMMLMVEAVFIETLKFVIFLVLTTIICGIGLTNIYNLANIVDPIPQAARDQLLDTSGASFTLFWAIFGLVDPSLFQATPYFQQVDNYDNGTRWGFAIWGFYLAVVSVLLINLIIALLTIAAAVVDQRLPAKIFRRGIRRMFALERAPITSFFTGPFLGVIFFGYIWRFIKSALNKFPKRQHPSFSPRARDPNYPVLFEEKQADRAMEALLVIVQGMEHEVRTGSENSIHEQYIQQANHGLNFSKSTVFEPTLRMTQDGVLDTSNQPVHDEIAKHARALAATDRKTALKRLFTSQVFTNVCGETAISVGGQATTPM